MPSFLPGSSSSHWERIIPAGTGAPAVVRAMPSTYILPIPPRIASGPKQPLRGVNWGPRFKHYVHYPRPSINNWLSVEILTHIFLYAVEAYWMTPYQLVGVCRRWRNIINSMAHLWSTLRLGTWTEIENVSLWLERSRQSLLTVRIDVQRDIKSLPSIHPYSGLQHAFRSMDRWQDLVIASFPAPEMFDGAVDFLTAKPMGQLTLLEVGHRCPDSATLTHLLSHISKTAVLLFHMSLRGSYAISSFLQPERHHVLRSVTTLIFDGKGISQPVPILPLLVHLQILAVSHLPLPDYDASASLPFLSTLKQLKLRAVPIQWMAGREFKILEGCTIIHPIGQGRVRHKVDLPCCKTLTYQGHPISTLRYFHAPQMKKLLLKSHETRQKRAQEHLDHLCRLDGNFSQLHTLRLTLQCSEKGLIKVLKSMEPLQELILSIAYPSSSWTKFLESLAAVPASKDWRNIGSHQEWREWCSSQSWHTSVLPHLKYLGIQSTKGFSQSQCFDNCPLFRLVAHS